MPNHYPQLFKLSFWLFFLKTELVKTFFFTPNLIDTMNVLILQALKKGRKYLKNKSIDELVDSGYPNFFGYLSNSIQSPV